MNTLFKTKFESFQEAEETYKKAKELFDQMVGTVYKSALADEIIEIYKEMCRLKKDNKNN